MGVRVTGASGVASRLENSGKRSSQAALKALRHGAEEIRDLASQMAPRRTGRLENSIKVEETSRGGINGRTIIDIGVPDRVKAAKYAWFVHEGINFNDNPLRQRRSKEKQAQNPAVRVGAFFLERAINELEPDVRREVNRAVRRALRG